MPRVYVDFDPDEYLAFKKAVDTKTEREAILDSMGIKYEKRTLGRPSNDEVSRNYAAFLERCRKDQLETVRQNLIKKTKEMQKRQAEG